MKIAIGRKQLIVSFSDVCTECRLTAAESLAAFTSRQETVARATSRQRFADDRARREISAQLNGAARLRTP
jgi:hypothetical protein